MATYTKLTASVAAYTLTSTISTSTATSVTLALSDGTTLVLTGSGFVVSGGVMTAGLVTSMAHKNVALVDVETWTGLSSISATALQANLTPSVNNDGFFGTALVFNDTLIGNSNADLLKGYAGSDFIRGLAGNDTIDGGDGTNDMAAYDQDSVNGGGAGVVVNLSANAVNVGGVVAAGTARDGFGNTDTLINIEEAQGTAFADTFVGGTSYNFFQGRAGADTYISNIVQYADNYYSNGYSWVDFRQDGGTLGVSINLTTGTGTDSFGNVETFTNIVSIRGTLLADNIIGNQYFNNFQTLQGNDTVNGGGGYDQVDYSRDQTYGGVLGVNVNLTTGGATDGWGNADMLTSIESVFGTNFNDTLTGNNYDNFLGGLSGNDTLIGGDGFDRLRPGLGTDIVNGSVGTNVDQGYDDRDRVEYSDLTADGTGLGVIINLSTASITFESQTVNGNTARDTGGSVDTLIDIERARGTTGRDYFRGSDTANLREERFEGLAGNDYINGGAGFNIANYQQETANYGGSGFGGLSGIIVNLSAASITVGPNTVAAGTARDAFGATDTLISIQGIIGTGLADYVVGGSGYDNFRGYGGADFFDGGAGTDDRISFFIDEFFFGITGSGATVNMVAGTATASYLDATTTTFINVENVSGTERNDSITGNSIANGISGEFGADTINGGDGDDIINGGAGADSLIGGNDFDIVSYNFDPTYGAYLNLQRTSFFPRPWTGVSVNLQVGIATDQAGDTDTISGFEGITGTFFKDFLIGDGNNNTFYGLSGNDTINGAGGNDTVTYDIWGATDGSGAPALVGINASRPNGVIVNLATGTTNDAEGGTDRLISIENVTGSLGADSITGNDSNNVLSGGDGNDTIVSHTGTDVITGGIGTDLYMTGLALSAITVSGSAGAYVFTSVLDGQTQTVNEMENYAFAGGAPVAVPVNMTFNVVGGATGGDNIIVSAGLDDSVDGLGGNDVIYTLGGNDRVFGGIDNDVLVLGTGDDAGIGGDGNDFVVGEDGNDALGGGNGNDVLLAGNGDDILIGGADSDYLYGGTGNNYMTGGAGLDIFISEGTSDTMEGGDGAGFFYRQVAGTSFTTGGADADIFVGGAFASNDIFNGAGGNDYALGGAGNDELIGGDGNDILISEDGNDTLDGGAGFNYIYMDGTGSDVLRVNGTYGGDQILTAFEAGGVNDVVQISGSSLTSFADIAFLNTSLGSVINGNLLQNTGGGAILTLNIGTTYQTNIWFQGTLAGGLTTADFTFG
jgi:Ca2+-binding RTX toxin-like protein